MLAGGLLKRDGIGGALVGAGVGIIAGALLRRPIFGGMAGFIVGGIGGYYAGAEEGIVAGILSGTILGGSVGWYYGKWAEEYIKDVNNELSAATLVMKRNKVEVLKKFKTVSETVKVVGPYHSDPKFIMREYRYVRNRLTDINYDNDDPESMLDATIAYEDVLAELERLEHEMDPYTASMSWSLDTAKYGDVDEIGGKYGRYGAGDGDDDDLLSPIEPSSDYRGKLKPIEISPVPENVEETLSFLDVNGQIHSGDYANIYTTGSDDGVSHAVKVPRLKKGKERDIATMAEFMYSTKLWGDLEHENIVKIHGSDTRPVPFISMERMDGGHLGSLMGEDGMSVNESVHIILKILLGLSYAHEKAVFHRNISPGNILLTSEGEVKITDWGWDRFLEIAHQNDFLKRRIQRGYCTPEHVKPAKFGKLDARTDVYMAGIIFYEMLTGTNPFTAEDENKAVESIIETVPTPPSKLNPSVPRRLDFVVMKALEKEKDDRWNDAGEMRESLLDLMGG